MKNNATPLKVISLLLNAGFCPIAEKDVPRNKYGMFVINNYKWLIMCNQKGYISIAGYDKPTTKAANRLLKDCGYKSKITIDKTKLTVLSITKNPK